LACASSLAKGCAFQQPADTGPPAIAAYRPSGAGKEAQSVTAMSDPTSHLPERRQAQQRADEIRAFQAGEIVKKCPARIQRSMTQSREEG